MSRILLSYIGYPVGAGKFLKKALRSMGHEVTHIGPDAKGYLPWQPQTDFSAYADAPDIALPYPYPQKVYETKDSFAEYDLILQCDAGFYLKGDFKPINAVWEIDNHVVPYSNYVEFDIIFGAHSWGYDSDKKNFHWVPCAYSPSDHYEMPNSEKPYDLVFLGCIYNHRFTILQSLKPYGNIAAGMGVLGEEYNRVYNLSRIGFCQSLCGDLPMRVFENSAQGCMIFCDRQRDLDKLGLKEGIHYVGFSTPEEAVEKFKSLLAEPEWVKAIAKAGKVALKDETYQRRVETMFNYL